MPTKQILASLAAALMILGAISTATAQDPVKKEGEKTVTEYKFPDELVKGALGGPNGSAIKGDIPRATESLIKVRTHFVPEMIMSAEDL